MKRLINKDCHAVNSSSVILQNIIKKKKELKEKLMVDEARSGL